MTTDPRPATVVALSMGSAPAGPDSLSGHAGADLHTLSAAEGTSSPQANLVATSTCRPPAGSTITRPARQMAETNTLPPAGHSDSLGGHRTRDNHGGAAAEGQDSPQARVVAEPKTDAPAGSKASHGQDSREDHHLTAVAGSHLSALAGDSMTAPTAGPSFDIAYKLLGYAAVILDDQEKVRIQAENRLRQMIRAEPDADGRMRGLGLRADDPAVANLARLVRRMKCDSPEVRKLGLPGEPGVPEDPDDAILPRRAKCCLEHIAEFNLIEALDSTPLAAFPAKAGAGVGPRQFARLIGAAGEPYFRSPSFDANGGQVPGSGQPRTLSQWRAYCGHGDPERRPFKGMSQDDAFRLGNRAAKMRAHLIAEQCIKYTGTPDKNGNAKPRSPYRDVYDAARAEYAGRVHARECRNASRISPNGCGTRANPEWGEIGSPWRDGHQHAAALRLVAKTFLDDLYAEAKRIHEQAAG